MYAAGFRWWVTRQRREKVTKDIYEGMKIKNDMYVKESYDTATKTENANNKGKRYI